ncbi:acetate kinase [Parageobacillus toebii]|uniref:acetate kinase n=1 Tax=Parageobacillus toebii TaxID=153151 RepID=UPI0019672D07|nr:acetate kinase [Parageobacillus toebii]QSB49425.1 acetate kinase [Parageobacillus toebii]
MSKKIMAINAGSSSLKFKLFEMPSETVIAKGIIERIGLDDAIFSVTIKGTEKKEIMDIPNHDVAVQILLEKLIDYKIIHSFNEIAGVGHRVAHGGEFFKDSVLITEEVLEQIEQLSELAPLHNPANVLGIRAFQKMLGNIPSVAVFDTAFHQTMPESSYLYSLPYHYYKEYGIRKYGFHGISHKYVSQRAGEILGQPLEKLRLISCHLGNGASIAAIESGKSIDTSMGFTPLEGVVMGTRSGSVDPSIIPFIMKKTRKSADDVLKILNTESGLLGLSGFSSDLRDIEKKANEGDARAKLSLDIFSSHIHKYIGSYAARMNGVDAIIFTAGIGENSPTIRAKVLKGLEFMGVYWDPISNQTIRGKEAIISYPHSPVKVLVIPTNEELMIARDVLRISKKELVLN